MTGYFHDTREGIFFEVVGPGELGDEVEPEEAVPSLLPDVLDRDPKVPKGAFEEVRGPVYSKRGGII